MARFLLLLLLLLLSLLTLVPAPTYHLWMAAILVTEFPWVWLLLTGLLLLSGRLARRLRLAGTVVAMAALCLFSIPVLRALAVGSKLGSQLAAAFHMSDTGRTYTQQKPFSIIKMITGIHAAELPFRSFVYDSDSLRLDFYAASTPGIHPCVVMIHGGSWQSGNSRDLPELNSWLALRGYHVAAINYHKAPAYQSPTAVNDALTALRWLKSHASQLGIDSAAFILAGRSAGAQIALVAAYTAHDPAIKGVISFYGPADMVWGYTLPANPLVMDSRKVMRDYLGGSYNEVPQQYAASSATMAVSAQAPPTLMIHGLLDPLVAYEHNLRLIARLKSYRVPYFLLTLPWATHGCDYTLNGPSGQLITFTLERFLQQVAPAPH